MDSKTVVRHFGLVVLTMVAVGCTNSSDPRQASTFQLLTNTAPIEQHLAERRGVLFSLRTQVDNLDERVNLQREKLARVQRTRAEVSGVESGSAAARKGAEQKLAEEKAKGEQLAARIEQVRSEVADLQARQASTEAERSENEERVESLQGEIKRLEHQVQFFEDLNAETVRASSEDALREPR